MYMDTSYACFEAYVKQKGYRNITALVKAKNLSSSQMADFKKTNNMAEGLKKKVCSVFEIDNELLEQILDTDVATIKVGNPDPIDEPEAEPIKEELPEEFAPTFQGIQEAIDNGLLEDPRDIEMKAELDKVEQEAVEHLSFVDSIRNQVIAEKQAEWEQIINQGVVQRCDDMLEQVVIDYKSEGSIEHLKTIVEIAGSLIELKEGKQ